MINQISLANTIRDIVNTVISMITVSNSLTDGSTITSNGELILRGSGASLNVRNNATVAGNVQSTNLTASVISVTGSGTALNVSSAAQVGNLTLTGTLNTQTLSANTLIMTSGNVTIDVVNVANASFVTLTTSSFSNDRGNATLAVANISSINTQAGNITLSILNASRANVINLRSNITNSVISFSSINAATFMNCTVSSVTGFTKSDVGLANVDNTSDAAKNAAVANLTNKTLDAPLIIGGNTSGSASLPTHIANRNDVDARAENPNGIINGSMDIWQRGNTFNNLNQGGIYLADRWYVSTTNENAFVHYTRSNNVPTVANSNTQFNYALQVQVRTANTGVGSGDFAGVTTVMEGYNWKFFAQKYLTLSFWVSSSKIGTYSLAMFNYGADKALTLEYTINAVDTWEYKTISIPPSPSDGTWDYTSNRGVNFHFSLAVGTSMMQTPGSWRDSNGTRWGSNNQVNFLETANNLFLLTGVKLETGNVATALQPVQFEEELRRCKRYYQKSFGYDSPPLSNMLAGKGEHYYMSPVAAGGISRSPRIQLHPKMRTTPSITLYNPAANGAEVRNITRNETCSSTTTTNISDTGFEVQTIASVSTIIGDSMIIHWTASCDL